MSCPFLEISQNFSFSEFKIGWNYTVSWDSTDGACRLMSFLRIFGLYLSSFVIICITVDRYFAVLKPMGFVDANRHAKWMLVVAWISSFGCSLPQVNAFTCIFTSYLTLSSHESFMKRVIDDSLNVQRFWINNFL